MFKRRNNKEEEQLKEFLKKSSKKIREDWDGEIYVVSLHINRIEKQLMETFTEEQKELYAELAEMKTQYAYLIGEKSKWK